ncbi:MAG: NAD-dependent epimerase/dehydratase family protein [Jatrophihabitantaceae bacterium]
MDVLVLGGSVFVGRAVVDEALALGADVTVFNRGTSGPRRDGTTHIIGDRTVAEDLEQLRGRHFDLVVDTCGYVPAEVALSANLLADSSHHYGFVSSINAYPGWPTEPDYRVGGVHDGDPDATRADVPEGLSAAQDYGWLKVGCERAVERAFGASRCAILRAGSIVGPHDSQVGRLPWWVARVARGGEILVPGRPGDPVAPIDSRDLAQFALGAAPGTFEATGPSDRDTRADLMAGCLAATGAEATLTYIEDEDWLTEQGVGYWTELPLWIPASIGPGVFAHHSAEAEAAGLRWRPLADTIADTWAWMCSTPGAHEPAQSATRLAPEREDALLASWKTR